MTKVNRGIVRKQRRSRYLRHAKGNFGRHNRCYVIAKRIIHRAWAFSFKGRKERKRTFRSKFISIINTFCRQNDSKYSTFINKFNSNEISSILDRKSFSLMIQNDLESAKSVYQQVMG